jgi:hypothetical protein
MLMMVQMWQDKYLSYLINCLVHTWLFFFIQTKLTHSKDNQGDNVNKCEEHML